MFPIVEWAYLLSATSTFSVESLRLSAENAGPLLGHYIFSSSATFKQQTVEDSHGAALNHAVARLRGSITEWTKQNQEMLLVRNSASSRVRSRYMELVPIPCSSWYLSKQFMSSSTAASTLEILLRQLGKLATWVVAVSTKPHCKKVFNTMSRLVEIWLRLRNSKQTWGLQNEDISCNDICIRKHDYRRWLQIK